MSGNRITILSRLSLGGMEMAWFAVLLLFLNRKAAGDSLPWLAILLFYPIAAVLNRSLRGRIRTWKLLLLNGIGGLMLFAILMGFQVLLAGPPGSESGSKLAVRFLDSRQAEFWIFLASGAAWALGCRLAFLKSSFSTLFSEFQFGLAILFIALFVEHRLQMNLPYLVPLSLLFFSFALIGAGLAHGNERAGWISSRFSGTWVFFLLVAVALILSAGLLITVLVSPAFIQFLLSLLYRTGEVLLGILVRILKFLLSHLPVPEPSQYPLPPSPPKPDLKPEDWSPFFLLSDATREILRILWTIIVSSVLVVALWRACSQILDWLRRRMGISTGDEVEPLPGAFRADLRILLLWIFDTLSFKWLFRLLARRKGRIRESDSIRQAYTRVLQWAAAKGCRRQISQTPFEYLPRLYNLLPEAGEDFTFITRQYVRARYSLSPPGGEVLEEVKHRWKNIQRRKDRKRKKDKKKLGEEAYERSEK